MQRRSMEKVLEEFDEFPLEDKEYFADVIRKRVIEAKREKILSRAEEADKNFRKNLVRKGKFEDLYQDLEGD